MNRIELEKARLEYQTLEVRRTSIQEQIATEKMDLDTLLRDLPEEANEQDWEEKLVLLKEYTFQEEAILKFIMKEKSSVD